MTTEARNLVLVAGSDVPANAPEIRNLVLVAGSDAPPAAGFSVGFNSGESVDVPNDASLQLNGDATFEMWVKPASFTPRSNLMDKALASEGAMTLETSGVLTWFQGDGASTDFVRTSALTLDEWSHVVFVRSGTTMTWYVNGVLDDSDTAVNTPVATSTSDLTLGDGYAGNLDGLLDEVAFYDRALSAGEIAAHFAAVDDDDTYRATVLADGPVSYWRLDEAAGPTAADVLGVNPGTYTGTPTYQEPGATGPLPTPVVSPPDATTLTAEEQLVSWTETADDWQVTAGSSVGASDYFDSGALGGAATSVLVTGLPVQGETVHVRVTYTRDLVDTDIDLQYTAWTLPAPVVDSPTPGSTLTGTTVTFEWTAPDSDEFWLYFGSTSGGTEYEDTGSIGGATSYETTALPDNGSLVIVRLWYRVTGGPWLHIDPTYTAFTAAAGGGDGGQGSGLRMGLPSLSIDT